MKPYIKPSVSRNWFYPTELRTIYNFPSARAAKIAVISFGGGLVGDLQNNILTNGDVQKYWTDLGVTTSTVQVFPCFGATNNVNDSGSTAENTLDVETIGAACPGSTISLYIAPNTLSNFVPIMNRALQDQPNVISISWGAPESYFGSLATQINTVFAQCVQAGINVCVASGDNGSSDGISGTNADFPASSPNVIACGGTRLYSPNYTYDSATVEQAWSFGGGAVSRIFGKPAWQNITASGRAVPDIALVADPSTGVRFYVQGQYVVYGGTSVAAPLMAAYCACAGFSEYICPKLYRMPRATFHDILVGSNGAYRAGTGYDFCTGLGSINGQAVLQNMDMISVSPLSLSLRPGQTGQLTANQNCTWSSGSPSIATVINGLVTAIAVGSTMIVATGTTSVSIPVTVTNTVYSIRLNTKLIRTLPYQLNAITNPIGLPVVWSTNKPRVAQVSNTGMVTWGGSRGTAIITGKCGNLQAMCTVIK